MTPAQTLNQRIMATLARGPTTNIKLRDELGIKEKDICLAIGRLLLAGHITARMEKSSRIVITYRTNHPNVGALR